MIKRVRSMILIVLCFAFALSLVGLFSFMKVRAWSATDVGQFGDQSTGVPGALASVGYNFDETVQEQITQSMIAAYEESGTQNLPRSWVKEWAGSVVQQLSDAPDVDNNYGIDGNTNSALFYSPFTGKTVYLELDELTAWNASWSSLGTVMERKTDFATKTTAGEDVTYEDIIIIRYGYLYSSEGEWNSVADAYYDSVNNCFVAGDAANVSIGDSICGELRSQLGKSFVVDGKIYQNYARGYAVKDGDTVDIVGGRNMTVWGEEIPAGDSFILYNTVNWEGDDWYLVGLISTKSADSYDMIKPRVEALGYTVEEVEGLFAAKYKALAADGFNAGMARTFVKDWGGLTVQEFAFGDGVSADLSSPGWNRYSILIFNAEKGEVFLCSDRRLMDEWNKNYSQFGYPVCDQFENKTVTLADGTSETYEKLMVFSNGYVYMKDGTTGSVLNVVYDETASSFNEIPELDTSKIPGEMGSKTTAYVIDGVFYQNYNRGYVVVKDGVQDVIALRNVAPDGTISFVEDAWLLDMAGMINTDPNTSDDMKPANIEANLAANGSDKTLDELAQDYKAAVKALSQEGYSVGVAASFIKTWNGYVVQDFQCGDGNFSWNNGSRYVTSINNIRGRVTTLVYNPEKDAIYAVTGDALYYFAFNLNLGCPEGNMELVPLKANMQTEENVYLQQFSGGIVWLSEANFAPHIIYGAEYDETEHTYTVKASPYVPTEYGALVKSFELDGVYYLNYEYGSVKVTPTANGMDSEVWYSSGRNYNDDGTAGELMDAAKTKFVGMIETAVTGMTNPPFGTKEEYLTLMKAKYEELWEKGICAGLIDGRGGVTWTNVFGSQFYWGDSEGSLGGYGDNRVQVTYFVFVKGAEANEVVSLTGNMLTAYLWLDNFNNYGSPVADAVTESNGDVHQQFANGCVVLQHDSCWLVAFVKDGTYQDYAEKYAEIAGESQNANEKSDPVLKSLQVTAGDAENVIPESVNGWLIVAVVLSVFAAAAVTAVVVSKASKKQRKG